MVHWRARAQFIIDNAKCAITRACAQDPLVQRAYAECAEGYGFKIDPCPPLKLGYVKGFQIWSNPHNPSALIHPQHGLTLGHPVAGVVTVGKLFEVGPARGEVYVGRIGTVGVVAHQVVPAGG